LQSDESKPKEEVKSNILPLGSLFNNPIFSNILSPPLQGQDPLSKLESMEQQFKQDIDNIKKLEGENKVPRVEPPQSSFIPTHVNKYTLEKLEKFSKINEILIKSDRKYIYEILKTNIEQDKHLGVLLEIFKDHKKRKVFDSFINVCENIKWNRYYIRELIKMKMGIIDINKALQYEDQNIIQRKNFFNYDDLKKNLVKKLIEKEQRGGELIITQNLYHLKIIIFTQKSIFTSTKILQNLFFPQIYLDLSNVQVEEGPYFINFSDINNFDENLKSKFSIFINVIFMDQIEDMPQYINENFESLNKFSYGLVYMDYRDINLLKKLTLLLDYATRDASYKDILLVNYYKLSFNTLDREDMQNNILLLEEKYQNKLRCLPSDSMFFPLREYSSFFNDLLEFFNNQEIFYIFDREIEIQKFENFKTISVYDYVKKLKFSDMILDYEFSKINFVSNYDHVTEINWIRFFTHVSKANIIFIYEIF
jgi:hypothetical protein